MLMWRDKKIKKVSRKIKIMKEVEYKSHKQDKKSDDMPQMQESGKSKKQKNRKPHKKGRKNNSMAQKKDKQSEAKSMVTAVIKRLLLSNYIFEVEKRINMKKSTIKAEKKHPRRDIPVWRWQRKTPSETPQVKKIKSRQHSKKETKENDEELNNGSVYKFEEQEKESNVISVEQSGWSEDRPKKQTKVRK